MKLRENRRPACTLSHLDAATAVSALLVFGSLISYQYYSMGCSLLFFAHERYCSCRQNF